jgi:hypothetical protein
MGIKIALLCRNVVFKTVVDTTYEYVSCESELRMLKVTTYNKHSPQSRVYGLLCLLFLAFVALYPLADAALDAFSDHLAHSPRMLPEDRIHQDQQNHPSKIVLIQQASALAISVIIDGPVFHVFITRTMPATAVKTSQTCPPLSSDSSPPVV